MSLKEILDEIIADPTLAPEKVNGVLVTHCNQGARRAAQALGCHEFDDENLTAEDMGEIMDANASGKWLKVIGSTATVHALNGGLAFAFMSAEKLKEKHAHIATIYPLSMQMSGSLGKEVPCVANVGKTDAEEKESLAFPPADGEPDYFCWTE